MAELAGYKNIDKGTRRYRQMEDGDDLLPHREVLDRFRQAIPGRHWLAHGRHFPSRSGIQNLTPATAWRLGAELFDNLPLIAPLQSLEG